MTQTATPTTYAQDAYVRARGFTYADDASFAKTAATFGARTALKTTAVTLAVFQTAWYASLSAATFLVSFIDRRAYDHFSSRMNTSARVISDVAKSAVWGDPKTSRPNPNAKPLDLTRVQKLKASAKALLVATKQKASNAASGTSALAAKAGQKVSSTAAGAKAFASTHRKEILIATVAVATAAAAVALYQFGVFSQAATPGTAPGTAPGTDQEVLATETGDFNSTGLNATKTGNPSAKFSPATKEEDSLAMTALKVAGAAVIIPLGVLFGIGTLNE